MSLVIDSSYTLSWIYGDEISPAARRMLDAVSSSGAWVPALWPLEVGNSLQMAVRSGRIDVQFRDAALADLACLDIKIDSETCRYAWSRTIGLSHQFKLTTYDACYLELAQRKMLPMASLDKELRTAAKALGISVL